MKGGKKTIKNGRESLGYDTKQRAQRYLSKLGFQLRRTASNDQVGVKAEVGSNLVVLRSIRIGNDSGSAARTMLAHVIQWM